MYYLFEEETFLLGTIRCTVRKIEMNAERVQVAAAGGVYAVSLGKSFAQADDPSYFLTGIVDADGNPWTEDGIGEPQCVIVHGSTDDNGRIRERAKHILSAGDSFPMERVFCTVRSIDPAVRQIQIEAAGAVYTIRIDGSFAEFGNE
jgi:hypothetical protein